MVPGVSPREAGPGGENVSRGLLPFGSAVPVPRGWQPADRKPQGRAVSRRSLGVGEASCASPTLLGAGPAADPTDLVQAALIGLPLVFVGLGQRRVLCLQDGGTGQKGGCGVILPSGQIPLGEGRGGEEPTTTPPPPALGSGWILPGALRRQRCGAWFSVNLSLSP